MSAATACRAKAPTAGFWFGDSSFPLPPDTTAKLGGPLEAQEIASIERIARAELERAFARLAILIVPDRNAFWRVGVVRNIERRGLPSSGESIALGPLGGAGAIDFTFVAVLAVQYAPPGASRQTMLEGIGRGVGRVAVHEFAHQILGGKAVVHDGSDERSYEYPRPERASQYYGELHWTIAWPQLQERLGLRRD